ncbi:hypothetical protein [Burkholderia metallica]|uniref:hypothetical protein n=1 Tax=Burkholderia metallica TaxID=488729 RepID=UPI00158BE97D|nr:hypothetical protein [Burkholderia metallica]
MHRTIAREDFALGEAMRHVMRLSRPAMPIVTRKAHAGCRTAASLHRHRMRGGGPGVFPDPRPAPYG